MRSIETTIRKRRLLFAGALARQSKEGAITQSCCVRDDDRYGRPESGRTAIDLAYMPS